MHRPGLVATIAGLILGWACTPALALRPDQLLLVTNKNNPDSRKLAERYANVRHVPEGRIVELSLPTGDEITFEQYERNVVPPIRQFLTENKLQGKVTCLVTFYGVPLRITRRAGEPGDVKELAELQAAVSKVRPEVESIVVDFEKMATKVDPAFQSRLAGAGTGDLATRADRAARAIEAQLPKMTDAGARDEAQKAVTHAMELLAGPNTVTLYLAQKELGKADLPQAERERWGKLIAFAAQSRERFGQHLAARFDAGSRAKARELAREQLGLLEYAGVVQGQLEYLRPGDTTAALDSELALVWWELYARTAWLNNPLYVGAARLPHQPVMMTCRVDGPDLVTANRMLADSLRAEQDGLSGRLVIDSRGMAGGTDAFAKFDRHLLALAGLVKAHQGPVISLFVDEKSEVLPPNSADNVALYAGWYSVGHYVPGSKLVPGSVAVHIASFELTSLHSPGGAWVPNLLKDGAAASVGAVAEPYLGAFPLPEEFFGLLMTGKVTLAEAYWRTTPMTSWMMALVGDPLYNPFAKTPALRVEDLPGALQAAVREMTSVAPTTQP